MRKTTTKRAAEAGSTKGIKRVTEMKSPKGVKRAATPKVSIPSKRAVRPKVSIELARAVPEETPNAQERVVLPKTTKGKKRVELKKNSDLSERATSQESSEPQERVAKSENTESTERLWGSLEDDTGAVNLAGPTGRPVSVLRMLADTYMQTQRLRIQTTNRLGAVERGADLPMQGYLPESMTRLSKRLEDAEKECAQGMENALVGHPAMEWLGQVSGVGPVLAAKTLAMIDIRRCNTISALWRFAGYGVVNGKRERPVKGEKLHYCIRLKTALYLVGGSFLKLGDRSPYRRIYDESRVFYSTNRPDWTEGHRHAASMRRMIKLFLAHLWLTWRQAENLPVRDPYVIEKLGHTKVEDPWNYTKTPRKVA